MSTETSGSEESPQLTFVQGRAIEQHESLDSNLQPDEREEAKKAVREAIKKAQKEAAAEESDSDPKEEESEKDSPKKGTSGTAERGPDGKFLPKEGKTSEKGKATEKTDDSKGSEEEDIDVDKATVKQLLRNREKLANVKKEAKDEMSKLRQEMEAHKAELQRSFGELEAQKAALAKQRESMNALLNDPARAIRELGLEPERFIVDLAQEGTPEGRQNRKQKEIDSQLAEIRAWKEDQLKAQQRYQQQMREQQAHTQRQQAVQEFTKLGLDESKYPHIANFYDGNDRGLVAMGDIVAQEYRRLSGGREGSFPDILDYIEDQLAEKASKWYTKSQKNKSQKAEEIPTAKSTGKSLSPGQSGERRSMQAKNLKDLDGEERLEAAKQAVKLAIANSVRRED
jgi:hypothetical protein